MNTHSKAGLTLPPYVPTIAKGENPYLFEWMDFLHQRTVIRLMTPTTGEDRKRRCPEAEAVLAWLLDASSGAQTIKTNPRPELAGKFWLWRSYDELAGLLFLDRDEVQRGVGLLRSKGLIIMEMARVGKSEGKGRVPCFRLTDDALRVAYVLSQYWWSIRDELEQSAQTDGGKAGMGAPARRAKTFYRKSLALAYAPPSPITSLPEMYDQWLITKDTAAFEERFAVTLRLSAIAAELTL